jgi:hypothetical protein
MVPELLLGFAVMFLGITVTNMLGPIGRIGTWLCLIFGIVLVVAAFQWQHIDPYLTETTRRSLSTIASNGYVWLGMVSVTWLYLAANNLMLQYRSGRREQSSEVGAQPRIRQVPNLFTPEDYTHLIKNLTVVAKISVKAQIYYSENLKCERLAKQFSEALSKADWTQPMAPTPCTDVAGLEKGVTVRSSWTDPSSFAGNTAYLALQRTGVDVKNEHTSDLRALDYCLVYFVE